MCCTGFEMEIQPTTLKDVSRILKEGGVELVEESMAVAKLLECHLVVVYGGIRETLKQQGTEKSTKEIACVTDFLAMDWWKRRRME